MTKHRQHNSEILIILSRRMYTMLVNGSGMNVPNLMEVKERLWWTDNTCKSTMDTIREEIGYE